jgi:multiple antibiotic resistance protein
MRFWIAALHSFLLAFPALFSIVNPIGGALIFNEITADRSPAERLWLARRVGFYALLVMLGALWGGTYVLNFFGITLAALRIAGGLVIASQAWSALSGPDRHAARAESGEENGGSMMAEGEAIAFFPLTMPLTTGPGTISVAIAFASERPHDPLALGGFFLGASAAAALLALLIWVLYRSAERLMALLGPSGVRVASRLIAFILLCIGTQITLDGIEAVLHPGPD